MSAGCNHTGNPDDPDEVRCWAEVPFLRWALEGDVDAIVEYVKAEIVKEVDADLKDYLAEQERLMIEGDGSNEPIGLIEALAGR